MIIGGPRGCPGLVINDPGPRGGPKAGNKRRWAPRLPILLKFEIRQGNAEKGVILGDKDPLLVR